MFNTANMSPAVFYKQLFVSVGIGFWLSWLATILALISTAGIFPDLIGSGAIDLLVSKPIGRLRLFATEYLAGLLFVTLQVTLFGAASFLVIGLRGGAWEPGLLVAVPVVVCFFSYLFAVCVLLGVLTRSTVAALLLTFLFWFFVYGIGNAERSIAMIQVMQKHPAASGAFVTYEVKTDQPGHGPGRPVAGRTRADNHAAAKPRPRNTISAPAGWKPRDRCSTASTRCSPRPRRQSSCSSGG